MGRLIRITEVYKILKYGLIIVLNRSCPSNLEKISVTYPGNVFPYFISHSKELQTTLCMPISQVQSLPIPLQGSSSGTGVGCYVDVVAIAGKMTIIRMATEKRPVTRE